ncbi:hypothetical protein (plasmid) [Metabacillus dongyingensis]|nr:hypothetical protein [Metabacillus dongyingensis]
MPRKTQRHQSFIYQGIGVFAYFMPANCVSKTPSEIRLPDEVGL